MHLGFVMKGKRPIKQVLPQDFYKNLQGTPTKANFHLQNN